MASRNANNRRRGVAYERWVANLLGWAKVGQLNLPWDVESPGYARLQCKKLADWPSFNEVIRWMDAIPEGTLRGVVVGSAPGTGKKARHLLVLDLAEYAAWHGSTARGDETLP